MNKRTVFSARHWILSWTFLSALLPRQIRQLFNAGLATEAIESAPDARLLEIANIDAGTSRLVRSAPRIPAVANNVARWSPHAITLADENYPELLRQSSDPPATLFFEGKPELLALPAIAIVGSRKASPYGINVAVRVARDLAGAGAAIVSGLAIGIDTAAHRAALDNGGATIAVLGTGIDVAYPRSNRRLQESIASEGLVLTEFLPGTAPKAHNFPVRNRIIAGLALGVVVAEASERSGSLITARIAAEEGREVFAVPGSIFSGRSRGTHRLIQDGAKLVHDMDDVFAELPSIAAPTRAPEPKRPEEPELASLWDAIPADSAVHPDFLVTEHRQPPRLFELLLALELSGAIRRVGGGGYVRN